MLLSKQNRKCSKCIRKRHIDHQILIKSGNARKYNSLSKTLTELINFGHCESLKNPFFFTFLKVLMLKMSSKIGTILSFAAF